MKSSVFLFYVITFTTLILIEISYCKEKDEKDCPTEVNKDKKKEIKKLMNEAEGFHMKKKYRDAISSYGKAIKIDPSNEKLYYKRSRSLSKIGNYKMELKDLNQVLKIKPDYMAALAFRGKVYYILGDCDSAKNDFQAVLKIKPTHGDAKKMHPKTIQCQEKVKQAKNYLAQRRYNQAEISLTELIDDIGKSPRLQLLRAQVRYEQGLFFEAVADCGDVVKKEQDNIIALLLRGKAYYALGDHEMATRHFKEALSQDPDHKESKDWFKKLQKILKLTKLGMKKAKSANNNDQEEALISFNEALNIDPAHQVHNKILHFEICKLYAKKKMIPETKDACEKAIQIDNEYLDAYIVVANLILDMAEETPQFEEALRAWQRALDVDRNDNRVREGMQKAEVRLKQSKQKNYYKTLGVKRLASTKEIKSAYRKLARDFHPDRHGEKSEEEKEKMTRKFEEIGEAYEVLSNDELRGKYDRGEDVFENQGGQQRRQHPFFQRGGFQFNF